MNFYWPEELKILTEKQKLSAQTMIREIMGNFDLSHNYDHVKWVAETAVKIAQEEGVDDQARLDLIWLFGLCHDAWDHKYPGAESNQDRVLAWIRDNQGEDTAQLVAELIDQVSWSKEQKLIKQGKELTSRNLLALICVQDADRLQAIGALGIARCFAFGAVQGSNRLEDQRAHFDEKLLLIEFKTKLGRELARGRRQIMIDYCRQFDREII